MIRRRVEWALRHPVSAVRGLLRWLERHPRNSLGRSARARRLLSESLAHRPRALVVGPPHVVRQALPDAILDLVGTNPDDAGITVVSEALGPGSLPRRGDCVIVTDRAPRWERLAAAAAACRSGGVLVVLGASEQGRATARHTRIEDLAHSRDVRLIVAGGAR